MKVSILSYEPFECNSITKENNEIEFIVTKKGFVKFKIEENGTINIYTRIIEKGFVCDLASIPVLFQSIFPKEIEVLKQAGGVHDYGYRKQDVKNRLSRKAEDKLFKEILIYHYFDEYKPNLKGLFLDRLKWYLFLFITTSFGIFNSDFFYYIVRIFGKKHYVK